MKTLGPAGMKWLKIAHILLAALFFGGIMSSLALNFAVNLAAYHETFDFYRHTVIISDYIIRICAVGTLLIGLLYGIFTKWGFFKHRWIAVKWVLFIIQTFIGIFIVDQLMEANMAMLEAGKASALKSPVFMHNHTLRQYAAIVQIAITVFIICISVLKPWKKKKAAL